MESKTECIFRIVPRGQFATNVTYFPELKISEQITALETDIRYLYRNKLHHYYKLSNMIIHNVVYEIDYDICGSIANEKGHYLIRATLLNLQKKILIGDSFEAKFYNIYAVDNFFKKMSESEKIDEEKNMMLTSDFLINKWIKVGKNIEQTLRNCAFITMYGKKFKELIGDEIVNLVKLTNYDEIHNGLQFQLGEIKDIKEFDGSESCKAGGIYFILKNDIRRWLVYNDKIMVWKRHITDIPDDAFVYIEYDSIFGLKIKASKIVLGPRELI